MSLRVAAVAALVWAAVFTAVHLYWFAGGEFMSVNVPEVDGPGVAIFTALVGGLFVAGHLVPLAIIQPWGKRVPPWLIAACLWTGTALLLMRGAAGILDLVLREVGITGGLTGMSYEEVTGDPHRSTGDFWSTVTLEANFVLGGVLYGLTAARHHERRRHR
jgi:hypothetical protein